jgi:MFS family permease
VLGVDCSAESDVSVGLSGQERMFAQLDCVWLTTDDVAVTHDGAAVTDAAGPLPARKRFDPSGLGLAIVLVGATVGIVGVWLPFQDVSKTYPPGVTVVDERTNVLRLHGGWLFVAIAIACAVSVFLGYLVRRETRGPVIAGTVAISGAILSALFAVAATERPFSVQSGTAYPGLGIYAELLAGVLMLIGGYRFLRLFPPRGMLVFMAVCMVGATSTALLAVQAEPPSPGFPVRAPTP